MRHFHFGLEDGESAHESDTSVIIEQQFILEDPSQPTSQRRVFPGNKEDAALMVTNVNSGPSPIINAGDRSVDEGQPSTFSAIDNVRP